MEKCGGWAEEARRLTGYMPEWGSELGCLRVANFRRITRTSSEEALIEKRSSTKLARDIKHIPDSRTAIFLLDDSCFCGISTGV